MFTFNPKRYFIRAVKYLVYITIFLFIFIALFSAISGSEFKYEALFRADTKWQMAAFILFFSLIYPIFGYIKKKVYINNTFEQDREKIVNVFLNANFVLVSNEPGKIVFRHKSSFIRLMRMYEDAIILDYTDNPITIEGQRKDIYRLSRTIEYAVRTNEE
jgi:hypothetical protein